MFRVWFLLYTAVTTVLGLNSSAQTVPSVQGPEGEPFLYFAYGSNLLKKRIKINNKSAHFITSASLPDWRLDFNITVDSWNGAVATIAPQPGSTVWGDLWLLSIQDLENLDKQEGVKKGWYYATNVTVNADTIGPVTARTYVEFNPPEFVEPEKLPPARQPSKTYFKVILYGAIESHLPISYLKYLERFPNNGKSAMKSQLEKLEYPFCDQFYCE